MWPRLKAFYVTQAYSFLHDPGLKLSTRPRIKIFFPFNPVMELSIWSGLKIFHVIHFKIIHLRLGLLCLLHSLVYKYWHKTGSAALTWLSPGQEVLSQLNFLNLVMNSHRGWTARYPPSAATAAAVVAPTLAGVGHWTRDAATITVLEEIRIGSTGVKTIGRRRHKQICSGQMGRSLKLRETIH